MIARLKAVAAKLQSLLQGEPVRVITYGAAVVVWVVTHIAVAMGFPVNVPSLDAALASATAIAVILAEACRRIVYAPDTVAGLLAETDDIITAMAAEIAAAKSERDAALASPGPKHVEPQGRRW